MLRRPNITRVTLKCLQQSRVPTIFPVRTFSTSTTLRNATTTVPPTINVPTTPVQPTITVPTAPTSAPQIDFTTVPTIDNFDSLKAQTVTNIATQVDSWASPFNPVNWAVDLIEWTHDTTGLPWWATIAVIGFSMRLVSSPLNIIGTKNSVAMANHGDEMRRLQQKAREFPTGSPEHLRAALEMKAFMKEKNISMLKMFAPMASMPFFIIFFIALRRMASEYESFQWGGISWFTDLSVADPYMILPVISALGMLASFEVAQSNKLPSQNAQVQSQVMLKYMRWFMRGMAAISILITKNMPTAIFMYWIPNNIFSMLQNVVLRIPAVKRLFGIPEPIAKSSADILAMRNNENMVTKTIGKIFPSAVKEHKADTTGVKLMTQEELHKLRKKK